MSITSGWGDLPRALVAFPPTSCTSSGCNRRDWLESEEVRLESEGAGLESEGATCRGVGRISSDFVDFLRLQPEGLAEVGGSGTGVEGSGAACVGRISSDFVHFLRLQPEEVAGVGGSAAIWR